MDINAPNILDKLEEQLESLRKRRKIEELQAEIAIEEKKLETRAKSSSPSPFSDLDSPSYATEVALPKTPTTKVQPNLFKSWGIQLQINKSNESTAILKPGIVANAGLLQCPKCSVTRTQEI